MKNSADLRRPPGVVIRPVGLRTLLRDPDRSPHPIGRRPEADKSALYPLRPQTSPGSEASSRFVSWPAQSPETSQELSQISESWFR